MPAGGCVRRRRSALVVGYLLAVAIPMVVAQGHGGGGHPGGGMPGGGFPGDGGLPMGGPGGRPQDSGDGGPPRMRRGGHGPNGALRGGLHLGPPGRWWDDMSFAKDLGLRADQQSRMDAIFESNRGALISRFQALRQEESRMEALAKAPSPDEGALFSQIDRVSQARGELEKANTRYLLQIRKEMDPEQIDRLEQHR